jgi:hypothetical protein
MRPLTTVELVQLKARSVHRIEDGRGLEVAILRGQAWITQEGDRRDIILGEGQSFVLDRPGVAVVFAFADTIMVLDEPQAALPAAA